MVLFSYSKKKARVKINCHHKSYFVAAVLLCVFCVNVSAFILFKKGKANETSLSLCDIRKAQHPTHENYLKPKDINVSV